MIVHNVMYLLFFIYDFKQMSKGQRYIQGSVATIIMGKQRWVVGLWGIKETGAKY